MTRTVFHPSFIMVEVAPGDFHAFEFRQYGVTSDGLIIIDVDGFETTFAHEDYVSFRPLLPDEVAALTT